MTAPRLLLALAPLALAACGGGPSADPAPRPAAAVAEVEDTRCRAVADSLEAATPTARLAIARPVGRPTMPRPPRSAGPGMRIETTFLVRPNGRADPSTVEVTGTNDHAFREDMRQAVERTRFEPVERDGCRIWARGSWIMQSR